MRIEEWSDEGDPPGDQDSYYGWDVFITVEARTYYARRYKGLRWQHLAAAVPPWPTGWR